MDTPSRSGWHALEPGAVLARLGTGPEGLSAEEAGRRLARVGPNQIRAAERAHPVRILLHQFTGALMYVLFAALGVSLAIRHWADAIVIGVVLVVNAVVGFFQEYRAERAIAALMGLVAPRATVLRDGRRVTLPSTDVVPGDVVLLQSGDVVPADLRIAAAERLRIDEALLTGESLPAAKTAERLALDGRPSLGDRRNEAFMGSVVTSGRGRAVAVATGAGTELGAIAADLRETERAPTPLQQRMARFGRRISLLIVALSGLVLLVGLARGEALGPMFLTAIAVAVSAVPEGLPVVMTIALATSVRRMARRNALVRRLPAVETLGSCTVIVTDKTGTLTENRMTVREIWSGSARYGLGADAAPEGADPDGALTRDGAPAPWPTDGPLAWTLRTAVLCNEAELHDDGGPDGPRTHGDPTEVALLTAGARAGLYRDALLAELPQEASLPFEPERRFGATAHRTASGRIVLVKGAPERVIELCGDRLGPEGRAPLAADEIRAEAERMGASGLRVLGLACSEGAAPLGAGDPEGLTFLGLVGMLDPPRRQAAEAVAACQAAGIRVIMVSGDHAGTALAIAARVGIPTAPATESPDLAELDDEALSAELARRSVFARVAPAEKLRIVQRLAAAGEVVAVTGDGVNDAPALKAAHVGCAMGASGTDVAKEASDIVLADDHFATVGAAVEEGRTAFANLRKATLFLVSSGVGELLAILGSLALRLPLPLLPAQILWLNVVTNGVEDVALAVEPSEPETFRRPPRDPREGILSGLLLERLVLSGLVMATGTLGVFFLEWGGDPARLAYARVAALTTMVTFQIFHVGNCRSDHRSAFARSPLSNPFLLLGAAGSALLHLGAMHAPVTQRLLGLEPLTLESWLRIALVAASILVVVELHKLVRRGVADGPT